MGRSSVALPAAKVVEHSEADFAAFLEVELCGDQVAERDDAGEAAAVVGGGIDEVGRSGLGVVGVDEVDVGAVGDVAEELVGLFDVDVVPADLGDFEAGRGGVALDHAGDDAEARGVVFFASLEENLDADADAEHGRAAGEDFVAEERVESEAAEVGHGGAGGADAGQDDALGGADDGGLVGDDGVVAEVFEGAEHALKVAGFVVDDGDHRCFKTACLILSVTTSTGQSAPMMRTSSPSSCRVAEISR